MGTDLSMLPKPDYSKFYLADTVLSLVKSGKVQESVLDDKVRRILQVMFKTKMFEDRPKKSVNTKEHQVIALKVAEEGIVLLKNEGLLPLSKQSVKSIAIIGANADRKHAGAGGSSQVNAKYEITPLAGLKKIAGDEIKINYVPGYVISKDQKPDPKLIAEAVKAASAAERVVYVGGWIHGFSDSWNDNAYDTEGKDKPSLQLPFGQDELLQAVLRANPNTVVVLMGGGPTDMSAWADKTKAIVQAWYPGMEGGNALANILFGSINPTGKLPMTFPKKLEDSPAHALGDYPGVDGEQTYKDDIYVGYRYFDTRKVEPLFCFGHGLSYTTFEFRSLAATLNGKTVTVKLTVKNTGSSAGGEVVQVYVSDETASVERPEKELKGFKKIFLNAGESKEVEIVLTEDAFKFYDETKKDWFLEPGKFIIKAGSSSRDIKQTTEIVL
jgi:beta-glucosidase